MRQMIESNIGNIMKTADWHINLVISTEHSHRLRGGSMLRFSFLLDGKEVIRRSVLLRIHAVLNSKKERRYV